MFVQPSPPKRWALIFVSRAKSPDKAPPGGLGELHSACLQVTINASIVRTLRSQVATHASLSASSFLDSQIRSSYVDHRMGLRSDCCGVS